MRRSTSDEGPGQISGVVMAAGMSRRLAASMRGSSQAPIPKQLLLFDGEPLIRRTVKTALASRLDEVLVVTGFEATRIGDAVRDLPVRLIENPHYEAGQSTSIQAGIAALDRRSEAAMFLPCDQPFLDSRTIDRLIDAWRRSGRGVVCPAFEGRRGAPVLWSRTYFEALASLEGDVGGRALIAELETELVRVEVEDPLALLDVDTAEDWERLKARAAASRKAP